MQWIIEIILLVIGFTCLSKAVDYMFSKYKNWQQVFIFVLIVLGIMATQAFITIKLFDHMTIQAVG